jgi:large subunit ribosomal protein L31
MKSNVHPNYQTATITCSCGHTFTSGSTVTTIQVDICSQCHPFYTGEMRFIDTQGRVERFQAKQKLSQELRLQQKSKKAKSSKKQQEAARSLKEVLNEMKANSGDNKTAPQSSPKQ